MSLTYISIIAQPCAQTALREISLIDTHLFTLFTTKSRPVRRRLRAEWKDLLVVKRHSAVRASNGPVSQMKPQQDIDSGSGSAV